MVLSKRQGKGKIGILLLVSLVLVMVIPVSAKEAKAASGTTYYISSSGGDDKNSGTSEKEAWKTLGKISEITLGPGDRILLKSGDRWLGEHVVITEPAGTEEQPAVLGAYGEGEKPKLALFENEVPKYQSEPLILVKNAEHFIIDGLDVGFCGVGVELSYELVTNKKNVRIQNCHFHDIYGFYQLDRKNITKYPHATGIVVTANVPIPGCTDPVLEGLYIDNCTSYDAGALYTYGSRVGSTGKSVKGLYVTNCVMENNGIYGIAVCNMDGGYMDNCKIINCGSRYSPMGSMGVMVSGENFTIMNSEICFQQRQEDNPDGGGIDFEHLCYDTDVINCYIHDNAGVGIMMYSSGADASHQNKRVRIIGNVFENNNQNVYNPGGAEILSLPLYSLVDGAIYNNRYMESENMFTMSMDASVDIQGNVAYGQEMQGKAWPVYDFDDVRAYVIEKKPLPDIGGEPAEGDEVYDWVLTYGNYFIGIAAGFIITAVLLVVMSLVGRKRKKNPGGVAALLLVVVLAGAVLPGMRSEAAENGVRNKNGTEADGVYRLAEMCNDEMGLWQYYWFDGIDDYSKMEYDSDSGGWAGSSPAATARIQGANWHTYIDGYTVATFTCPKSGTVRVGTEEAIELTNAPNTMDGTIFVVMSDDELVGTPVQVTKEEPKKEFATVEMDVYEGQVIGFYLHMNVTNAGDSTNVSAFVEYTDYKEVEAKNTHMAEEEDTVEAEKLRTDIKPTVEEEVSFALNPLQIAIGTVPVVLIGILAALFAGKKGKNKDE